VFVRITVWNVVPAAPSGPVTLTTRVGTSQRGVAAGFAVEEVEVVEVGRLRVGAGVVVG